jgi:hypothetical protein
MFFRRIYASIAVSLSCAPLRFKTETSRMQVTVVTAWVTFRITRCHDPEGHSMNLHCRKFASVIYTCGETKHIKGNMLVITMMLSTMKLIEIRSVIIYLNQLHIPSHSGTRSGFESRQGRESLSSLNCPDLLWGPTILLFNDYQSSFPVVRRPRLDTDLHLAPKLKMRGTIPLLHPYSFVSWRGTTLCV